MSSAQRERILAVPREALFGGAWPQGFVPAASLDRTAELAEALAEEDDRERLEHDPGFKQPIPYCLVSRGRDSVLCVRRKQAGSEARLHGRLSVGIGGHAHPQDRGEGRTFLRQALARELGEELVLPPSAASRAKLLGWINDDSTAVGRVHFGIAYWLDVGPSAGVAIRETSKLAGGFERLVESNQLWQDLGLFESWSRILLEAWRLPEKQGDGQNTI